MRRSQNVRRVKPLPKTVACRSRLAVLQTLIFTAQIRHPFANRNPLIETRDFFSPEEATLCQPEASDQRKRRLGSQFEMESEAPTGRP